MPLPAPAQLLLQKRNAAFKASFLASRSQQEVSNVGAIVSAAREKADETARKEGSNAAANEGWTAEAWLTQQHVVKTVGEILMAPLEDMSGTSAAELAFARQFGQDGSRDLLVALLESGKVAEALADALWPKFVELSGSGAASASELHQKFVDEAGGFELEYAGLKSFFGGLEAVVGSPAVKVEAGMRREHCNSDDSLALFKTPNYQMWTTSRTEWWFVLDPENGLKELRLTEWPRESAETIRGSAMPREPRPLSQFTDVIGEINGRLKAIEAAEIDRTEFIGARMYTGPCFVKYNSVLRGLQSSIPFFRNSMETLCKGNKYTTTMHVINSAVVKLSKLTFASEVYRGVSGGRLPHHFRHADVYGVRGGIDPAFMSTTTDRNVALAYAGSSGGPGVVFSIQQGMVDRGADIGWLSQYPHEKEILFAPLSGLEIRKLGVAGSVLVPEVRLSINLNAATIEEVIARRRKLLKDMGASMAIEVSAELSGTGFEDASVRMLRQELQELALAQDVEWYNEEENFQSGVAMVIDAKRHSLQHEKRLAWLVGQPAELAAHALPIVKLLRDASPSVRCAALHALMHLEQSELSPHTISMVPCLRDADEQVRSQCVLTLGCVAKDALAIEASAIANIVENATQHPYVRRAAVQALGHLDPGKLQQFAPLLLQNIVSKHGFVRRAVVDALGGLHATSLLPHAKHIVRTLEDPEEEVQQAAVTTLGLIIGDPTLLADHFPSILAKTRHKDGGVRASCARLLGKLEPSALAERAPVLVSMLNDKEERVRTSAVEVMARLDPPDLARFIGNVAAKLEDAAPAVRYAAVGTMANLDTHALASHLPAIVRCLSDDDKTVRSAAIGTLLGKMEITDLNDYVTELVTRIEDPDDGVRRAAALWATSKLDEAQLSRHAAAIAVGLEDTIVSVRRAALEAFGRVDVCAPSPPSPRRQPPLVTPPTSISHRRCPRPPTAAADGGSPRPTSPYHTPSSPPSRNAQPSPPSPPSPGGGAQRARGRHPAPLRRQHPLRASRRRARPRPAAAASPSRSHRGPRAAAARPRMDHARRHPRSPWYARAPPPLRRADLPVADRGARGRLRRRARGGGRSARESRACPPGGQRAAHRPTHPAPKGRRACRGRVHPRCPVPI